MHDAMPGFEEGGWESEGLAGREEGGAETS
jgi:hypothetical protein